MYFGHKVIDTEVAMKSSLAPMKAVRFASLQGAIKALVVCTLQATPDQTACGAIDLKSSRPL